jgi:hypothetical protein
MNARNVTKAGSTNIATATANQRGLTRERRTTSDASPIAMTNAAATSTMGPVERTSRRHDTAGRSLPAASSRERARA